MLFTAPVTSTSSQQAAAGHELGSNNVYTLGNANTSPPAGLRGFQEFNHNPACIYSYMLYLRFSGQPESCTVTLNGLSFPGKVFTWDMREVGNVGASTVAITQDMASIQGHFRILLPALVSPTSIRIAMSDQTRPTLVSANFHRVVGLLHPSPAAGGLLHRRKATTRGILGRVHATSVPQHKVFSCRLRMEGFGDTRTLEDVDLLEDLTRFAVIPSGMDSAYITQDHAVKWRKPEFMRNCAITQSAGLSGVDMLDTGGAKVDLRIEETS